MKPRTTRAARPESSLWLLAFGCLTALCLALCGQSPLARAEEVSVASASASAAVAEPAVAEPAVAEPSMARL
ncbi:MAG TPA: hypothetical protein VGC79_04450, partial [Polyangiaceae bacterium]